MVSRVTLLSNFRTRSHHSVCAEICSAAKWRVSQATARTDEYHRRLTQIDLRRRVATLEFVFAEDCAIPPKHPDSHDSRELSPLANICSTARSSVKHLMTASTIALIASSGSVLHRNRVYPNSFKKRHRRRDHILVSSAFRVNHTSCAIACVRIQNRTHSHLLAFLID